MRKASIQALVILVLTGAVIILVLAFSLMVAKITDESTKHACASAVITRATALQVSDNINVELPGCKTTYKNYTQADTPREIRDEIVEDALTCYYSFGGDIEIDLLGDADKLCHVCAIYEREGGGEIGGIIAELFRESDTFVEFEDSRTDNFGGGGASGTFAVKQDEAYAELNTLTYDMAEPLAVIFVQEKEENLTLLGKIMGGNDITAAESAAIVGVLLTVYNVVDVTYMAASIISGVATGGASTVVMLSVKEAGKQVVKKFVFKKGIFETSQALGTRAAIQVGEELAEKAAQEAAEKAIRQAVADAAGNNAVRQAREKIIKEALEEVGNEFSEDAIEKAVVNAAINNNVARGGVDLLSRTSRASARAGQSQLDNVLTDIVVNQIPNRIASMSALRTVIRSKKFQGTTLISSFFFGKMLGEEELKSSGIVISTLNQEEINALGCTITKASTTK